MPLGLHGIFPVRAGCDIHVTGGGFKVAYSHGKQHIVYSLGAKQNVTQSNVNLSITFNFEHTILRCSYIENIGMAN